MGISELVRNHAYCLIDAKPISLIHGGQTIVNLSNQRGSLCIEHGVRVEKPVGASALRQMASNRTSGSLPTDSGKIIELEDTNKVFILISGLIVEVIAGGSIETIDGEGHPLANPFIKDRDESALIGALMALSFPDLQLAGEHGLAIIRNNPGNRADLIGCGLLVPTPLSPQEARSSIFPNALRLRMVTDNEEIARLLKGSRNKPPLRPFTVVFPTY